MGQPKLLSTTCTRHDERLNVLELFSSPYVHTQLRSPLITKLHILTLSMCLKPAAYPRSQRSAVPGSNTTASQAQTLCSSQTRPARFETGTFESLEPIPRRANGSHYHTDHLIEFCGMQMPAWTSERRIAGGMLPPIKSISNLRWIFMRGRGDVSRFDARMRVCGESRPFLVVSQRGRSPCR